MDTYKEEIQILRRQKHIKAWDKVIDKISEGQIVSRHCKKYQAIWRFY